MGLNVQIIINCRDPDFLAGFWATTLGYEKQDGVMGKGNDSGHARRRLGARPRQLHCAVIDPEGRGMRIFFQRVRTESRSRTVSTLISKWARSESRRWLRSCQPSAGDQDSRCRGQLWTIPNGALDRDAGPGGQRVLRRRLVDESCAFYSCMARPSARMVGGCSSMS